MARKTGERFPQTMGTIQVRPAAPPRQLSGLGFCAVGFENLTGGNNGIFIRGSSRTSSAVALLASLMGERSHGARDGGQSLLLCLLPLSLHAQAEAGFTPRPATRSLRWELELASLQSLSPWGPGSLCDSHFSF